MVMELQHIFYFITFSILFSVFVSKVVKDLKTKNNTQNLPPGPCNVPVIGNMLHLVGSQPHHALRDLARRYGPLMRLQLGEISAVIVSTPRVAEEIFKTQERFFLNRPQLVASQIAFYNNANIAFSPHGDYWRLMRKVCASELLSPMKVASFTSLREAEVSDFIESIKLSSGSLVDLTEKVFSLINTIICKATFGGELKDQVPFIQMVKEIVFLLGGFDISDLFPSLKFLHMLFGMRPKLEKMHQKLDHMLEDIINEQKNLASTKKDNGEAKAENLLEVLIRLQGSSGLESPITSKNIKAVIVEMFAAGTDTASTLVEWAMSELIKNPRVMRKAQAELRETFKGRKTLYEADIKETSYLKFVVQETLRLHPPAPLLIPRECREQCEVNGYVVPVKTKVIINAWATGRDPDYWQDAESFQPERFESTSVDFKGNNFEYIPFGSGRRICPGMEFGLTTVYFPLAQLLYHFDWTLPNGMNPEDLDMSETLGAAARRTNSLCLIPTDRSVL